MPQGVVLRAVETWKQLGDGVVHLAVSFEVSDWATFRARYVVGLPLG